MTAQAINPNMTGMMNPYACAMANFANAYSSTDPMDFYGNQIGLPFGGCSMMNPYGGYGQFGDMYGMFGMMGYNPMQLYNPSNYYAMQNGFYGQGQFFKNQQQQNEYNNTQLSVGANIRNLVAYAQCDDQDNFKDTYNNLLAVVKEQVIRQNPASNYDDVTLTQIAKDKINNDFFTATGGQGTIAQVLKASGDCPFIQGVKNGLGLGLFNNKTDVEDNIALVNNTTNNASRKSEKTAKGFGTVIGTTGTGAAIGATAGAIIGGIFGGVSAVPGAIIGAKIGAGLGFVYGLIKSTLF